MRGIIDEDSILILAGELKTHVSGVYMFPMEWLEKVAPEKAAELKALNEEGSK